ncbi:MAG: hemolysin family protein [Tissierellia bacterium]|nr:hemolysin family protein [Tissierellia bacterium]
MDDGGVGLVPKLLLIVILTGINAFFASAEMALVSSNKNKINNLAEEGNSKAKALLDVTKDQTGFLSTIQVGITLAGFFSSGSAATSISVLWGDYLLASGIPYARTIAFVVVTFILSYITLVFGELVPKRIALQNAEAVAMRDAKIIKVVSILAAPFVSLLSISTTVVLKMLGKYSEDVEEKISEEELKRYIKVGQEQGVINPSGEEMIISILDFDDKLAYEIMTPRTSIYMINYDEFGPDKIEELLETGYSRAPVYKDNTDNIVGIVYIKDIFKEFRNNNYNNIDIDKILKEPYFVPESKNIDLLLKELQATKNYIAILIDEYGGFSGMVTVEDIVEEIVGEIEDEYDKGQEGILQIDPSTFVVDGSMDLDDINHELDLKLNSDNHETLSGLTIELLGFIPEDDDPHHYSVLFEDKYQLTVLGARDKRLEKVEIKILENALEEENLETVSKK